jgi:hypothetical protein
MQFTNSNISGRISNNFKEKRGDNIMNIVIPMAGAGSRFYNLGYKEPKPLIKIKGYPFFYYAAKSLTNYYNYNKLIFIGLKKHNENNILIDTIKYYFKDALIKLLDETPPGAVLTSREAIELIDNNEPVIFNDCDHCFYSEEFRLNQHYLYKLDGFLLTFKSDKPCYSYCIKKEGKITGTIEKKAIGNDAIAGVYGFKNISLFDKISKKYLDRCYYSEFYTSGLYNIEPLSCGNIKNFECDFNISFGTVDEFLKVKENRIFELFK